MQVKSSVASIVGPTDETHWGQILLLPHAYGVVEVVDETGKAEEQGLAVLSQLSHILEEPFADLTPLENKLAHIKEPSVRTLIALVPVGSTILLVLRGEGSVLLKRGDTYAWLLTQSGGLSGDVVPGDTILLASRGFVKAVPKDVLTRTIDHKTPQEVAEQLTLTLHQNHEGKGSAACVFQVASIETEAQMITEPEEAPINKREMPHLPIATFSGMVSRIRSMRVPSPRSLAQSIRTQPKRIQLFITVILSLLFLASVAVGVTKQRTAQTENRAVEVMNQARHSYEEGVALLPLNSIKGRERLTEAKDLLTPLLSTVSERSTSGKELRELYKEITDAYEQALQVYTATPEVFYDVTLLKKGGQVADVVLGDDTVGLIDGATRTVYAVDVQSKKGEVVGGGEGFDGAIRIASRGDDLYVLTTAGIHEVSVRDKKSRKGVVPSDTEWGTIVSMVSYGGNLYLLDSAKGRIWKYVAVGAGETKFSQRQEYLNPDAFPDLTRATSMAIDGSVWVGTTDGAIQRFTQGKENPFVTQGIEPAFSGSTLVYTADDAQMVYILEPGAKRVVVVDKEGMYQGQYHWEMDLKPTALAVSEEEKKLFLLSRGTMYTIPLK